MKQPFYFGMSVDDVALRNWCKPENFEHLIGFFQAENIPATFFVVPIDEESDKPFFTLSDRYLPLIRAAHAAGFDLGQHGLRHNRFELGIPPAMVLDLPHEVDNKRYAEENAEALERDHCVENCVARLQQGRKILEDAFGFAVTGFRAPALQESPGMFAALAAEKYPYDSSCVLQETGWDYLLDKLDVPPREITRERYEALRAKSHDLELPLTCDYTWYLTPQRYELTMKMARRDLASCMALDIPFVTVCHVDPVHEGEGLKFLHELYAFAREAADREGRDLVFANLKTIAEKVNVQ